MTSSDFVRLTTGFIDSSPGFDYLLKLLATIAEGEESLRLKVFTLTQAQSNTNEVPPAHTDLKTTLASLANEIRKDFDSRKVWNGVEDLTRRAVSLAANDFAKEVGGEIGNLLSRFSGAYEQYLKSYSPETTLTLVNTGNDLYLAMDSLRMTAVLARDALLPVSSATEEESELDLSFYSVPTFEEFVTKLAALSSIYQKLCEVMKISTANYPLRIAKIETGTWVARLIGSIPVIAAMTHLIKGTAIYLYRNYTTEGKISMLPRKAEAAEAILNLKKLLDQENIDTSGMDENIRNATALLTQDLNTLFGGESRVGINAVEINTNSEAEGLINRQRHLTMSISYCLSSTSERLATFFPGCI
jgi:hypothetical protein